MCVSGGKNVNFFGMILNEWFLDKTVQEGSLRIMCQNNIYICYFEHGVILIAWNKRYFSNLFSSDKETAVLIC